MNTVFVVSVKEAGSDEVSFRVFSKNPPLNLIYEIQKDFNSETVKISVTEIEVEEKIENEQKTR